MPLDPLKYSDPLVRVYEACVDEILVNLAKHFNISAMGNTASFEYEVEMLSKLGAVRRETAAIIAKRIAQNEPMLEEALKTAMLDALENIEPELKQAATEGLLQNAPMEVEEGIQNQLMAYSRQARSQLNLVNTVMLESTAEAFKKGIYAAVDIVREMDAAQEIINKQTGKVVIGTSTLQQSVRAAVKAMVDEGITGFVDRAGRKWSAEAYVRMDIKTTVSNAANAAVMTRNEQYGNDIVWPRVNTTARPGCYPWQGQLISMGNRELDVPDGNGKMRHVYPVSQTTYGQPAGIWGINCHHGPMNVFIPGFSYVRGEDVKPDQEKNDRLYQLTQEQRRLEREVRYAKRDAAMYDAAGDREAFEQAALKAKASNAKLKSFVNAHDTLVFHSDKTWVFGYNKSVHAKAISAVKKPSGALSGAKKTEGWEDRHAKRFYEEIRNRKAGVDAKKIAKYTPFTEKAAEEIRQHMFIKDQPLDYGRNVRPFYPDYEQAQAWQRLTEGNGTDLDVIMLKHEYVELTQMRLHGYVYEEAHAIADRYHNWWMALVESRNRK